MSYSMQTCYNSYKNNINDHYLKANKNLNTHTKPTRNKCGTVNSGMCILIQMTIRHWQQTNCLRIWCTWHLINGWHAKFNPQRGWGKLVCKIISLNKSHNNKKHISCHMVITSEVSKRPDLKSWSYIMLVTDGCCT